MAQGYFLCGKKEDTSVFDYFFRKNPFKGGFTVFAGLDDFLRFLSSFTFSESDLGYLTKQGFHKEFLDYLKTFRFKGTVSSVREGEFVFPNEPIIQVEGNIIECQLIESMLLNLINFESLIATKAFRIRLAAGDRYFSDFGLRRAQGLGSIHASRAAAIGGASSTSNVLAGSLYNIPVSGTQAHSWIQSFGSEIEAFRAFVRTNPENSILLVDTYDTLNSGVPNAVRVAKEMENEGHQLKALRLDSGDLAYLSKKVRRMLDDAELGYVKIVASNQLDEYVIHSLIEDQKADIDYFGVGTELITGKDNAALDGVYKLAEANGEPRMKFSENAEKTTLPGKKQIYRCYNTKGMFFRDVLVLSHEDPEKVETIYHPLYAEQETNIQNLKKESLLQPVVKNGQVIAKQKSIEEIHQYLLKRASQLPEEYKWFTKPHTYITGISSELRELRNSLAIKLKQKFHTP